MTAEGATGAIPVIDMCGTAYDADSWRANLLSFADNAPGYLQFFGATLAWHAGLAPEAYQAALARSPADAVEALLGTGRLAVDAGEHVRRLDAEGVRHQVLIGAHLDLPGGDTVNHRIAAMAREAPDRLQAWPGLDMARPARALEELDHCVTALGARGAAIVPFSAGVEPLGPECEAVFARAVALGVPVWLHTGMNLAANRPLRSCTWDHVDRIAMRHPDLVLIVGHGGWPWVLEGMAVLQRHRNVHLEFSAHRPKLMGRPGSGWEPLFFYGRTVLRDRILFGTAGFVQRLTIRALADEVEPLVGPEVARSWLHDNAARLLGLDPAAHG